jgi:hypothetical protein
MNQSQPLDVFDFEKKGCMCVKERVVFERAIGVGFGKTKYTNDT